VVPDRLIRKRGRVCDDINSRAAEYQAEAEADRDSTSSAIETQYGGNGDSGPEHANKVIRTNAEQAPERQEVETYNEPNERPEQVGAVENPAGDANQNDPGSLRGSNNLIADEDPTDRAASRRSAHTRAGEARRLASEPDALPYEKATEYKDWRRRNQKNVRA
jgi:hypothetical protein